MTNEHAEQDASVALELATLDQIYDELKRRYEGFLLITENPARNDDENCSTNFFWAGGPSRAVGLAARFVLRQNTSDDVGLGGNNA